MFHVDCIYLFSYFLQKCIYFPINHRRFSPSRSLSGAQDTEDVSNFPLALDDAITNISSGFSFLALVVVGYYLYDIMQPYALRAEADEDQSRHEEFIVPQSKEETTEHSKGAQNVTFHDYSPGAMVIVPSEYDEVHNETIVNDLDLNNFFARPVLVGYHEWQVNTGPGYMFGLNPWVNFWKSKRVVNRISNFKLLRAKLHIRVLLNGSPFHYGRAIVYYTPMQNYDDVGQQAGVGSLPIQNLMNNSQKPHLWLNPTTSQGGDMELPFLWYDNALDLPSGDLIQMGELDFVCAARLRHSQSSNTEVSISVLAWATDVVLSGPTIANADGIVPQSDEYSDKAFSVKASNVASAINKLSSAPIIGPYARATSLAASLASSISALFGFSKPNDLERCLVVPKSTNDMAISNGKDDSHKLALDAKQELTIDPRAFGLKDKDEMEIKYIASRESFVTNFLWTSGNSQPAGTILWNTIVDPAMYEIYSATSPDIPKINMTASCFAALPFQYWRGSIKYRFQVVCGAMHKGRLRIVYDPEIEVSRYDPMFITPEFNLGYQTVVDISETRDFEITVGWGQKSSYRENAIYVGAGPMHAITPLDYSSSSTTFGNGILGVYVMNELVNPSSTTDDISIIVTMCAGDDFEVAAPTNKPMSRLRYRTFTEVTAPEALLAPVAEGVVPQSAEISSPIGAVASLQTNTEQAVVNIDTLADVSSLTAPTNMVFFGESIRSFRTLLKRFTMVELAYAPLTATLPALDAIIVQRPSFPIEPGFTNKSDLSSERVTRTVNGKQYAYGFLTPLRFISSGFVGWRGSIRWKVSFPSVCCNMSKGPVAVTRYSGCSPLNISETVPSKAGNNGLQAYQVGFDELSTLQEGGQLYIPIVEPIAAFEVPFYTTKRFLPARTLTAFTADVETQYHPCWKIGYQTNSNFNNADAGVEHQLYCAAGEDFSLGMFIGAPIVYLESIPPI